MRALARFVAASLSPFATALAQVPPGAPMPKDLSLETTVPEQGAAKVRWQTGKDALAANDAGAAQKHLGEALQFHPSAAAILFDLALAWRADADFAPLWAERFVRAAADAQGKLKLDPAQKKAAAAPGFEATLKPALDLAALRSAAIAELARFVDKNKATPKQNGARAPLVRWASELLLELGVGAPGPLGAAAPAVDKVQAGFEPDYDAVFAALAKVMGKKPVAKAADPKAAPETGAAADADGAKGEDQRVRAARILLGLRRQAGLKDLKGPPGRDPGKAGEDAARVLAEQSQQPLQPTRVWTVAELEPLGPVEQEAFTQAHRDWRNPGVAVSPSGKYRVETNCGYHTLLGTARTIELHHARLVAHYGQDPFGDRQGLVRIVPEHSDMETEGTPFWWAGGFQSGDRTTVRFAWGNIPGLGRTLTHELTHRFDGVLKPFLGAWYGEGHASWTGGHYSKMADVDFVDDFLQVGTVAHTYYKGYGGRDRFEKLLKGEIEEYRDNYFAGYTLYAFLRSYPPGAPRYRSALATYEKNARAGSKDPVGYFASSFADGKDGRPKTFDEVCKDWETFTRGCYDFLDERRRGPQNDWVGRYGGLGPGDTAPMVMDELTWTWSRAHAEPFFGQEHAMAATLLLHEVGDHDGAIAAGLWSLAVDGWRPETATAVLASLRATKSQDAAQAFAVTAGRHFPQLAPSDAPLLVAAAPKTKAYCDALSAQATMLADKAPTSAATLVEDHGRVAALLALPRLAGLPRGAPPPLARSLGGHGFAEASLLGFDERRAAGLWYATADGDLHVGREKPRDSTGTLDRHAHQRDAFAHTVAWVAPGDYVVRGRVHLTTSFASGAIVLGHTRRDRGIRISFSSGDFDYATGRSDTARKDGTIGFGLQGMWERDGQMPGTSGGHSAPISPDAPWFDFALHVRGPRLLVEINGEAAMRYAVHDGTPIEGHVGFATGMGAIRVQQPTVQRRDGELAALVSGLDLAVQPDHGLDELLLLPVRGVPLRPNGTLVMLLPTPATEGDSPVDAIPRVLPVMAKLLANRHEHPQQWVLAVPKALPAAERDKAQALFADQRKEPLPVIEHQVGEPFDGSVPWVLFVDGQGVLRAAAAANETGLHAKVAKWARLFRPRDR